MKNQIERAEPSRGAPSWSKTMAEVQPCGHTNAQHLYDDSGDIKLDLSKCTAGERHHVSIEVFQHDWLPGFAALFDNGEVQENAKAHVVLNLGSLLSVVEDGDLPKEELPYIIAESLMHEVVHVLEAWAGVEFSEDRVEAVINKYREKYGKEIPLPVAESGQTNAECEAGNTEASKDAPSHKSPANLASGHVVLLEALKRLVEVVREHGSVEWGTDEEAVKLAEAAIRKAEI